MRKLFIGICITCIDAIGLLTWAASIDRVVPSVQVIYAWIRTGFILTSSCLMVCRRQFDRDAAEANALAY